MGILTNALNVIPAIMAGSYGFYPGSAYIAIGTSGTTFTSGQTALATERERNQIDTVDLGTAEQVIFTANWAPLEISGIILKEFGTTTIGSHFLNREVLTGSLVFDGESELQIQQTFKFFK